MLTTFLFQSILELSSDWRARLKLKEDWYADNAWYVNVYVYAKGITKILFQVCRLDQNIDRKLRVQLLCGCLAGTRLQLNIDNIKLSIKQAINNIKQEDGGGRARGKVSTPT